MFFIYGFHKKPILLIWLFSLLLGLSPYVVPSAFAMEYPRLDPANTYAFALLDYHVDFASTIYAIDQAPPETPILAITYALEGDSDHVIPYLQALRRAANRGCRVRVLASRVPAYQVDKQGWVRKLLADITLKRPIEFIEFGGFRNWLNKLNFSDFIHEKITVIGDWHVGQGTPGRPTLVFAGGRNRDGNHRFADLHFAFRAVDPTKASLVSQLGLMAEEIWALARKLQTPQIHTIPHLDPRGRRPKQWDDLNITLTDPRQAAAFQNFRDFAASPQPQFVEGRFEPAQAQAFNNDMLHYAVIGIGNNQWEQRMAYPDAVLESWIRHIDEEREFILMTPMSIRFHPKLLDALDRAIRRGVKVWLFTNSKESAKALVPRGLSYLDSLPQIKDLLQRWPRHQFQLFKFIPKEDGLNYIHMKLALFKSQRRVRVMSHNGNIQSTVSNTEFAVDLDDTLLYEGIENHVMELIRDYGVPMTCESALEDLKTHGTLKNRILNMLLRPLY